MSAFVQELKHAITTEIGVRIEDAFEAAKLELAALEGRQAAFLDGSKAAEALLGSVDKDIEESKFDLEAAGHIKKYLSRCANALQNLSVQAANYRLMQQGKLQGLDYTVKLLKGIADDARAKMDAMKAAEADPSSVTARGRVEGTHPPATIKEQRLAEEAAELAASAVVTPVQSKHGKKKAHGRNA
jgi:hypothetical protein